ncbi:MAG: chorismate synthase [Promethearchaeota archaeon]
MSGRHDSCIVPRVVPTVETIVAIVLLNVLLERDTMPHS